MNDLISVIICGKTCLYVKSTVFVIVILGIAPISFIKGLCFYA